MSSQKMIATSPMNSEGLFGPERHLEMRHPLGGSEDFSRVLDLVPGSFTFLTAVPEGVDPATAPYNHSA